MTFLRLHKAAIKLRDIFDIDEFMDTFFDSQSSDEFETLRKQDAAEIIPLLPHEAVSECLAMIQGAPKGRDEAHRRELLVSWTQCTRTHRVTML